MSARQAVGAVWRQRTLVLIITLLVLGSAIFVYAARPAVFSSTAQLGFSPAASSVIDGGEGYASVSLSLSADAVTSPEILRVAAQNTGFTESQLSSALNVEILEGPANSGMNVTATATVPERAQRIANAAANAYLAHLNDQVASALRTFGEQQDSLRQTQLQALTVMQTNRSDVRSNYEFTRTSNELTQLQLEVDTIHAAGPPAQLLNPAQPGEQEGQQLLLVLLIALASGIIAGSGLALARDQFDDGLRQGDDIATLAGASVIGELPRIDHARGPFPAILLESILPNLTAAVSSLRTTLQTSIAPHSVLAVTGTAVGDGKTFVASHLAITWARSSHTVILVDANLRRPWIWKVFGLSPRNNSLVSAMSADPQALPELLMSTSVENLKILPCTTGEDDPADLLAHDDFKRTLANLAGLADVVIVDTPPVSDLTDAALVAGAADATVVVASPGWTNRRELGTRVQLLLAQGTCVLGIVSNRRTTHIVPMVDSSEMGFYDLRVPETRQAQSDMARSFGVEAFAYWHYWFGHGKRILDRPFREVLHSGSPEISFCLAWANQTWSGIWHGARDRILCEQQYPGPDDEAAHFATILPAFRDERYLRVDDRPVFYVFRPEDLPSAHEFVDRWQEMARRAGLSGLYLVAEMSDMNGNVRYATGDQDGFDASVYMRIPAVRTRASVLRMRAIRKTLGGPEIFGYNDHVMDDALAGPHIQPCVYPNWDNTPRSQRGGLVVTGATPEKFRRNVSAAVASVAARPLQERFLWIKSWNEWAEDNHLEPDLRFGRGWLEALRDGLEGSAQS
ncbi:polysaccharide biosynthesis tyrosine autokinase [Propionibacterium sp.]|uniref:polysaccharide biosynthesis tyrosine autokinase n=1 Tax=Propionibacterium sp. TaxID=1977903 RepID=UPI0039EA7CBD